MVSPKFLLSAALLIAAASFAGADELHRCGQVISNRPCDSVPTPRSREETQAAQIQSKKSLLLHDLTTKALKAKRQYDIDMDLSRAEEVCDNRGSSLDECRLAVEQLDDRLDARLALRPPDEKEPPPPTPVVSSSDSNQVIVIQNNNYLGRRRGYGYGGPGYGPGYGGPGYGHGGDRGFGSPSGPGVNPPPAAPQAPPRIDDRLPTLKEQLDARQRGER